MKIRFYPGPGMLTAEVSSQYLSTLQEGDILKFNTHYTIKIEKTLCNLMLRILIWYFNWLNLF